MEMQRETALCHAARRGLEIFILVLFWGIFFPFFFSSLDLNRLTFQRI